MHFGVTRLCLTTPFGGQPRWDLICTYWCAANKKISWLWGLDPFAAKRGTSIFCKILPVVINPDQTKTGRLWKRLGGGRSTGSKWEFPKNGGRSFLILESFLLILLFVIFSSQNQKDWKGIVDKAKLIFILLKRLVWFCYHYYWYCIDAWFWCFCKSLPFFYFLTFEKGRLLYIHPVGRLVGWLTSPLIFSIYRGIKALF